MGRLSAAVGRLVQSLFHPAARQVQVYIDDVALMLRGTKELRNLQLAKVYMAAFGVRVAMRKGEGGQRVAWIGTAFDLREHKVVLSTPKKMVDEAKATLAIWKGKGMVPTRELRSFVGTLSWIAGIVPRLRRTVTALCAVLAKVLEGEIPGLKRLGATIPWLTAAFEEPEVFLIRHEPLLQKEPVCGVVTDASPKRIGGIVIRKMGQILEAFEAPVQQHQASALEIEVLESLAVLRALEIWATKFQGGPVLIRSDSSVVGMAKKLASSTRTLNYLASEISTKLIPQHVPGRLNIEADWLSCLGDRGTMPESFQGVKLRRTTAISERSMATPRPGLKGSPWSSNVPHPKGVYDGL